MGLSQKRQDTDSVFESFSDLMLAITVLLIALVAILAINVSVKSDTNIRTLIHMNRFTGGVERPRMFFSAYRYSWKGATTQQAKTGKKLYGNAPLVLTLLESPSHAQTYTMLDSSGNTTGKEKKGSFAGVTSLELVEFFHLAGGLHPGFFGPAGDKNLLLNFALGFKTVAFSRIDKQLPVDQKLARSILGTLWPELKDAQPRIHSYQKYRNAVMKIYVETGEKKGGVKKGQTPERQIWIGDHSFAVPDDIKAGKLDFLVGFSSANTQIIYLGEYARDSAKTDRRLKFWRENGHPKMARAYREYHYGWSPAHQKIYDRLTATAGNQEERRQKVRFALANRKLARAILDGKEKPATGLTPLRAYPAAWQAYAEHNIRQNLDPPPWFVKEVLKPLGFDKRVPREEEL